MIALLTKLLAPAIIGGITDTIKDYNAKKLSQKALQAEVEKKVLEAIQAFGSEQASVIKAEIQSDHWLTRSWRPMVALTAAFVAIGWYSFLGPITVNWFGWPALEPGRVMLDHVMDITKISLGGYIVGRSLEKAAGRIGR